MRGRAALALLLAALLCLSGCASVDRVSSANTAVPSAAPDTARYLRITAEEPNTVDPQCTDDFYDVALNVFDRLVEVEADPDGASRIVPSLAKSWEISDDGLIYTFHLHPGVTFSNGAPLTASDVEYTLVRALTHPDSYSGDIGEFILGSDALRDGSAQTLEGFEAQGDLDFTITLSLPYAAFLAILSIPGASILDEETTRAAGDRFGRDPGVTVGTGPFVFSEWNAANDIVLTANPGCWSGAPGCDGVVMRFVTDSEAKRLMFEDGKLDILDLENLGTDAEFFMRGDIYQDQLRYGNRVGLTYIALNESIAPLDDVRVRRALQLALDRHALLMSAYGGRGTIENGIYPHGLIGFDPDLPEIPYDPQAAAALLEEAGYADGFDLEISVEDDASNYRELLELAASMWRKVGVRASITTLGRDEFSEKRRGGGIACYASRFSVDFNDPDAIIYVFFGDADNARSRSLCYDNEAVIQRVADACAIVDEDARIAEYRELERVIVQEDCAWIPLFSNQHYFIVNPRVRNFRVAWNGWTNTQYRDVVIEE
ncbi:MAG: ABC transporter substrate-binding protein [Clostridia bacterium]|nr:ABC transporter substrate-binding protein [Clostridia bacterium]